MTSQLWDYWRHINLCCIPWHLRLRFQLSELWSVKGHDLATWIGTNTDCLLRSLWKPLKAWNCWIGSWASCWSQKGSKRQKTRTTPRRLGWHVPGTWGRVKHRLVQTTEPIPSNSAIGFPKKLFSDVFLWFLYSSSLLVHTPTCLVTEELHRAQTFKVAVVLAARTLCSMSQKPRITDAQLPPLEI